MDKGDIFNLNNNVEFTRYFDNVIAPTLRNMKYDSLKEKPNDIVGFCILIKQIQFCVDWIQKEKNNPASIAKDMHSFNKSNSNFQSSGSKVQKYGFKLKFTYKYEIQ